MLQEHTRCARHSQHPGIEGNGILADRILRSSCRTILGVVILDERHRILTIIHVADARVVLQVRPIVVVHSIAASITESEVEGSRLDGTIDLGSIDPFLHVRRIAIPIFAHRELDTSIGIIIAYA